MAEGLGAEYTGWMPAGPAGPHGEAIHRLDRPNEIDPVPAIEAALAAGKLVLTTLPPSIAKCGVRLNRMPCSVRQ